MPAFRKLPVWLCAGALIAAPLSALASARMVVHEAAPGAADASDQTGDWSPLLNISWTGLTAKSGDSAPAQADCQIGDGGAKISMLGAVDLVSARFFPVKTAGAPKPASPKGAALADIQLTEAFVSNYQRSASPGLQTQPLRFEFSHIDWIQPSCQGNVRGDAI